MLTSVTFYSNLLMFYSVINVISIEKHAFSFASWNLPNGDQEVGGPNHIWKVCECEAVSAVTCKDI
jgi:hypothetical protein